MSYIIDTNDYNSSSCVFGIAKKNEILKKIYKIQKLDTHITSCDS